MSAEYRAISVIDRVNNGTSHPLSDSDDCSGDDVMLQSRIVSAGGFPFGRQHHQRLEQKVIMMAETDLEAFLILRELEEPITQEDLQAVDELSTACRRELDEEGVKVRAVESEVLTDADGNVTGTHCHYKAESEEAVWEHATRAELPISRIDRPGRPLGGDFN